MKTGRFTLGFAYLRLSNEEAQGGESSSITNQRMIVQNYCKQNNITLVREFVDDGYSGGVAVCGKCGHALCSCGTVYKGEREKYWYLSFTHQRQDIANPCQGVRIRYADLVELVRRDLNSLLALSDKEVETLVQEAVRRMGSEENLKTWQLKKERAEARVATIDKIVTKLYTDNAMGKLDDDRLSRMVADLEKESAGLKSTLEELDRDTLLTFVERIEIGPKIYENGGHKLPARANQPYRQSVRIFYKFIGELAEKVGKCSAEKPA